MILSVVMASIITLGLGLTVVVSVLDGEQILAVTNYLGRMTVKLVVTSASFEQNGGLRVTYEARSRWIGEWALGLWCYLIGATTF